MNLLPFLFNINFKPEATAAVFNNETITYKQLSGYVNKRISFLTACGISSNDYAGLLYGHNINFVVTVLALWKIGAVPIPINTRLTKKETDTLLNFASVNYVITDENYKDNEYADITRRHIITALEGSPEYNEAGTVIKAPGDTALVIFTSGSTGKPKGVELSFANLISSAEKADTFFNQTAADRWLASLPFFHIGGFSVIVRALLKGSALIIPESVSAESICKSITEHSPTLASLVSTQLKRLLEMECSPNVLRKVLLGGGFIPDSIIETALEKEWHVAKSFGASETASLVTVLDCIKKEKINSAGKALPGNEILIINEAGDILPHGSSGEIIVKAGSVSKGYINNPEETALKFRDGFYYTGDIGYLDNEGYLFPEARRTDLIISGGENINPLEIENEIIKHPAVLEAVVFPVEDKEWGQLAAAAVILREDVKLAYDELKYFLSRSLAGYKIPRKIIFVHELPKTPLGKIKRADLPALLQQLFKF